MADNIYTESNQYSGTIAKGDEGTFFLNYNGKIAYAEAEKVTGGDYAFVLDVNTREPIFGTPIYTVLMMNAKGEWVQAELAAKVAFYTWDDAEGEKQFAKNSIEIEDGIATIADITDGWFDADTDSEDYDVLVMGEALLANRVIKYSLNSAGEISAITIPTADDEASEEDYTIGAKLGWDEDAEEWVGAEYNATRNRFAGHGKTAVADTTVIFTVDVESNDIADVAKKKEVSVASAEIFKDEELYNGLTFDVADDVYGAMIITSSEASIKEDAALLVVKDIYEEENDEEEAYLVITGIMNGEEVTLETVADTDLASAFEVEYLTEDDDFYENYDADKYVNGAVLEVAQDDAGLVTDIKVVYTTECGFGAVDEDYDYDDEDGVAYFAGYLIDEELDGNYTVLGEANGVDPIAEINVKNAKFVNVDLTRKTTKFSVEDNIEGFLDTLIYTDEDRNDLEDELMEDEETEVCFALAKVVDGYAVDVVIYTVVFTAGV